MINFALPNFYERLNVNLFMYGLTKDHPEFFREKVSFYTLTGSFPYSSWNGGINCNCGIGAIYSDFIEFQGGINALPIRLNMANVMLEETDYYDHMNAAILDIFNDGSTVLEISSIPLMEYIQNKHPEYRFVLSNQADLITPFTPDIINSISDANKFSLIGLPTYLNENFDFLKQIKNKKQIEIVVNPICPATCEGYNQCWLTEHENQINYSGKQNILRCTKSNPYLNTKKMITLETIKKDYLPLGFNHFIFSTQYLLTEDELLDFYTQYFIKPECGSKVLELWLESKKEV